MTVLQILVDYRQAFASGLLTTVQLAVSAWVIGIGAGVPIGAAAAKYHRTLGRGLSICGALVGAIPIVVILYWLHYPLQASLRIVIDPFVTAIVALSLVNTVGVANLIRLNVLDFPEHYMVAAKVVGLSRSQAIRRIAAPLLVRQALPGVVLLQITVFQSTLFASLISVGEIFRTAQTINATVYKPIEIYTGLACLFVITCLPMNLAAHWLSIRYAVLVSDH